MIAGSATKYAVAVLGGGINGLSTLYHLARSGRRNVVLLEQFRLQHRLGSSHGSSRITRSTYPDAGFVRLMDFIHREEWPRLERDAGRRLIHRCDGCFFGPPGDLFQRYQIAVAAASADVVAVSVDDAKKRFPLFKFNKVETVLHDRTAGVVDAAGTMTALAELAVKSGATIIDDAPVVDIDTAADPIVLTTAAGKRIAAEKLVVTAGPWTARLLPELTSRLAPARQTVGYFAVNVPGERTRAPSFPVWVYLGDNDDVYYGLPEFGTPGIKLGRHVTSGRNDAPADREQTPDPKEVQRLQQFLQSQLRPQVLGCVHSEHCFYTNTVNEDFIMTRTATDPRIVVGAGFSGHGFKFAPWTGRMLAELVLDKGTDTESAEMMQRFRSPCAGGR